MNTTKHDESRWPIPATVSVSLAMGVVDAIVYRQLDSALPGVVDFDRHDESAGYVRFELSHWQLGDVGIIKLWRKAETETDVELFHPSVPQADDGLYRQRVEYQKALIADIFRSISETIQPDDADDDADYAYPKLQRKAIVEHYRKDKANIVNKNAWARRHYSICGRTLKRYENEFP
jgi:hypothetical protein